VFNAKRALIIVSLLLLARLTACDNTEIQSKVECYLSEILEQNIQTIDAWTEFQQNVRQDLINRPDLIPVQDGPGGATLGGTFRFLIEDNIFVSFPYVFAVAEDGHTNVFMLFSFEVELDGGIVWELVAYDVGGIYCHGSKIKKVP